MPLPGESTRHGTKVAVAIVLLWFAGLCLFVAFLSGKAASLTVGKDQAGHPQGPADASELVSRLAENVQALEGQGSTGSASAGTSSGSGEVAV
jgi:hypothetical protein